MGSSRKHQIGATAEKTESKKSAARDTIPVLAPLKSISKKKTEEESGEFEEQSTTPRSEESRISEKLVCPAAPRKRRPASTCHFNGAREFFTPPDLESVFIPYVGRAN